MSIDINRIKDVMDELQSLKEDEVLYVSEDQKTKYVIMPIELYDSLDEAKQLLDSSFMNTQVKVLNSDDFELSYDEYERVKNQLMEIIEKTLMPKPEKLN